MEATAGAERALRDEMARDLALGSLDPVRVRGEAGLDSAYPVSDLAAASVATAALAAARLRAALGLPTGRTVVDRPLVDAWFRAAVRPVGWEPPPPWDPMAGDYRGLDGWIRLHTNAPHHRAAALRVLGVAAERAAVAEEVGGWTVDELEAAVVGEGGCAARLRSPAEWAGHPQGVAVAAEPLIRVSDDGPDAAPLPVRWRPEPDRPLAGLRVLDLTRIIAGPVATRLLALLGAEVLRIDPPAWEEPAAELDLTPGKRTARLDLDDPAGLERLRELLADADFLVHGYRPGALDRLGLDADARSRIRPGLVDVSLSAYGATGPWFGRRGFDSLVQMSSGIAGWGMLHGLADRPTPLPVQALDHATGYLLAAAALAGMRRRVEDGTGMRARLSLARTAASLEAARGRRLDTLTAPEPPAGTPLATPWGPATVLPTPFAVDGIRPTFPSGPRPLGSDPARW